MEVVRSLILLCFANPYDYNPTYDKQNFKNAQVFLQRYQTDYPLQRSELASAFKARYWRQVMSLWVETEHYVHANYRVDVFLQSYLVGLKYMSTNLAYFVDRICDSIL